MVAEYGDEIFGYMRQLEVSLDRTLPPNILALAMLFLGPSPVCGQVAT